MAGQLVRRGERTWLIRVFLGRDGGKRKYTNRTVHGTKRDAQAVLTSLLRDRDQGTVIEPSRFTLAEYLDGPPGNPGKGWLEASARPRLRLRTFDGYKALLNTYVRPRLGMRPLAKITPLEIQALYAAITEQGLSPRTVRYTHAVLRSALKQAVRWRLIQSNPADAVDLPRNPRKEMKVLDAPQVDTLLNRAAGTREYPLLLLAVTAGMRPSEYLGLKWSDLTGETLAVVRSLSRRGKRWSFEEPKRAASRRTVKLLPTVAAALREHKSAQAEERLRLGKAWTDLGLIFPSADGTPERERTIVGRFKRLLAGRCPACAGGTWKFAGGTRRNPEPCSACDGNGSRAALPNLRLYDLRHTAATLALLAGTPAKVVSEQLGHASVAFTLDVYSHVLPNMQDSAAATLEALLFGGGKSDKR